VGEFIKSTLHLKIPWSFSFTLVTFNFARWPSPTWKYVRLPRSLLIAQWTAAVKLAPFLASRLWDTTLIYSDEILVDGNYSLYVYFAVDLRVICHFYILLLKEKVQGSLSEGSQYQAIINSAKNSLEVSITAFRHFRYRKSVNTVPLANWRLAMAKLRVYRASIRGREEKREKDSWQSRRVCGFRFSRL